MHILGVKFRVLLHRTLDTAPQHTHFPSQTAQLPAGLPARGET